MSKPAAILQSGLSLAICPYGTRRRINFPAVASLPYNPFQFKLLIVSPLSLSHNRISLQQRVSQGLCRCIAGRVCPLRRSMDHADTPVSAKIHTRIPERMNMNCLVSRVVLPIALLAFLLAAFALPAKAQLFSNNCQHLR